MFYTPVSEQEAIDSRFSLLEAGHYPNAKIDHKSVEEGTSSKGNKFLKLSISIKTNDGHIRKIFCYLTDVESMRYLTRHLSESVGLLDKYENGTLTADDFRKTDLVIRGGIDVGVQPGKPKEDGSGEMWSPKNIILDFGNREKKLTETGKKSIEEMRQRISPKMLPVDFDDDIPF